MNKIIINGANGFVASNFIAELLKNNYQIIALVRGNSQSHAEERMSEALKNLTTYDFVNLSNLQVCNYSLLQKDFMIPEPLLKIYFKEKVDYFHFAASLKFSKKTREEIFETNINGLENSIRLFEKYAGENSRFFFISTAYSCGHMNEVFSEDFYDNEDISHFRNYYEQSKRFAENIIKKNIEENHLNAYIIRPSQVAGESKTGITKTDFGIFDFAKRIYKIACHYPNNRVRINASNWATQNLLPVDILVSYLKQVIEAKKLPAIMNFVAKNSIKNNLIIQFLSDNLPIDIIPTPDLDKNSLTPLEKLIDLGMSFTGSYSNINPVFSTKNLEQVVNIENNDITPSSLRSMLSYYINDHLKVNSFIKTG